MIALRKLPLPFGLIIAVALLPQTLPGQTAVLQSSPTRRVTPTKSATPTKRPSANKAQPAKSKSGEAAKPEAKKSDDGKKKDEAAKTIQRPNKPETAPDPEDLKLHVLEDGKVRFNYKGAPWPHVLENLAEVSGLSLDWQELPADYLNLVTQRSYTVEEARDLLNRRLLARGYTMLQSAEVLSVVNISKLDPSMVPRVAPEELSDRYDHEYVRVSFRLDWLLAEKAAEELKSMLSPNGKLVPLKETNRLETMDAVVNLREVYRLLNEEQSGSGQERLVRPFKLKYTKAANVLEMLQGLLGIEKKDQSAPMTPQQMQAMMRAQQQQAKNNNQAAKPKEAEVHLVVNERENSILASAPPDKMAVIEQAINHIDVPLESNRALLRNMDRMQVHRLVSLNPETLVTVLQDVANLDIDTRLEVDTKNKAIIAYASLADHLTIKSVIDKLDGSGREFHVIPLRRLESDYVAGTIRFMMGGEEDKQQQQSSRYYYYPYSRYGNQEEQDSDEFRVDADVEYNRLLLWANNIEVREVENLLVKLGEIPSADGSGSTMRVLDLEPGAEADRLLERIRRIWPSLGPNELLLDPSTEGSPPESELPQEKTKTEAEEPKKAARKHEPVEAAEPQPTTGLSSNRNAEVLLQFTAAQAEDDSDSGVEAEPSPAQRLRNAAGASSSDREELLRRLRRRNQSASPSSPPPISISRTADGRLVISSQDTAALNRMEDLLEQLAPPRKDYRVFRLQYADAFYVTLNLEEYFGSGEEEDTGRNYYPYYYYGYSSSSNSEPPHRLSRRKPLKFIYDLETNTILAQGGTPDQMKTVEDLIQLYDRPRTTDSTMLRTSKPYTLQYAKAEIVAEAIKDVYRDLLSANDKALQNAKQKEKPASQYTYVFGGMGEEGQKIPKFKGALSVAMDEASNTVIVSAQPYLLGEVEQLITSLEEANRPNAGAVHFMQLRNANAANIQRSLSGILGPKPLAVPQQNGDKQQPQQNDQNKTEQTSRTQPSYIIYR